MARATQTSSGGSAPPPGPPTRFRPPSQTLIAAVVLLAALLIGFLLLKPARTDTCASEILTNGQGMSVDLGNKTVKFAAERKAVPLQTLSDQSAVLIDSLTRLCRERQDGSINEEVYNRRFDRLVAPVATQNSSAAKLPVYTGVIDTRGVDRRAKRTPLAG